MIMTRTEGRHTEPHVDYNVSTAGEPFSSDE
eukprot:SAG31_NODE_11785_length_998_cov_9.964405_2_plen_30_part_01